MRLPLARAEASPERGAEAPPLAPAAPPAVAVFACGPHELTESPVRDPELLRAMRGRWPVLWVHVAGTEHPATLEGLRAALGFPGGVVDRLLDPAPRAGVERIGSHLLALAPSVAGAGRCGVLAGPDHLLTFHAGAPDPFAALRDSLRSPFARLRAGGPGEVALAAMERLVGAVEEEAAACARRAEEAEGEVAAAPGPAALADLHRLRGELRAVERALAPLPAGLRTAARDPTPFPAAASTRLRLLAGRSDAALESVGAAREAAAALGEACLAGMHRRLEARVRALTLLVSLLVLLLAALWLLAR